MSEQLKPELRFPEFDGNWFENTLAQLMTFKNGVNAAKENYGFGYKFINVLDIIENDFIEHDSINDSVNISKDEFEKNKVEYGDILFQRSSETRDEVGQANVYIDKEQPATFGGFVIRGKKESDYNPYFMNYLLKTRQSRLEIMKKSGGSTRYNVGQSTLSEVVITTTVIDEQQKIANFLKAIDKRIKLLKAKKDALEDYKTSIMQKLFSQEIRFKQDDGSDFPEWEEKRIDEIFDVTRGNVLAVPEMSDLQTDEYKYPVYSSQTKLDGLTGYYNEFLYQDAITWTTDGANAGEVKFRKGKFYCTNVCGVLLSYEGYANSCIAQLLNKVTHRYVSYVGNPKLMNNVMAGVKIEFPHTDEQAKISEFIDSIKVKVDALSFKIEEIENYKKSMLQKMFV